QDYKPTLYIEPLEETEAYAQALEKALEKIQSAYPGVELEKSGTGWQVIIPEKYKVGHEAHFSQVTEKYIQFMNEGSMPSWEVPGMLTKYYTTTKALEMAKANE